MIALMGFLVTMLIAAVIIYVLYLVLGLINLPQPIKTIIYLIVGLFLVLYLLGAVGINTGISLN